MSLSLGTLEIGLGLNTAQYDSGIKSAKDQLSSLEDYAQKITRDMEWSLKQSIPKLAIVPSVDHRPLHGLNKHLSEKEKHIDRVSKKVIKIKVDDEELQKTANKTVIVQASVQSKSSSQKYSNEIKQKVEVSIKNANLELLTEIKAVTKEIKEVVKAVSKLKPTAIGTISNSLIQGIGINLTKSFSQGFEQSFTRKTGFNFESAGQKTGDITASSVQFVQPVLNKLVDNLQIKIDKITGRDKPIGERILTASETFQKIQTKIGVSNNNPYAQKSIDNSIASFQNMLSVLGSGEFSKFPEASQKAITSLTELLNLISSENDLGELTKDLADLLKITIAFSGKDFLQIIKQSHSLLKTQKALEGSSAEFIGALKQAVSEQKIIEQGFRLIARENHKSFFVNDEGKYIGTDNVGGRVIGFTATPKQSMPGVGQDIYEIAFSLDSQFSSLGDAAQLTKKEVIQLKNSVSEFFNKFVSNTNEAILTASPENADQKGKRRGSIYQRFGFVPEGEGSRLVAQISSRKIVEPNLKFNLKQNERVAQISKQIEQRLTTTLGTFDNLFQHSISQAIQYAKSIIVGSELIQQDLEQLQKEAQNAEYDDSPAIQSQNKINQNLKNLQARINQSKRLQNDPILRDFSKIDITNTNTLVPKEQLAKIALKITKITENVPKEIVEKLLERVAQFQPEEIVDPTLLESTISLLTKDIQTQLTGVTPQLKMFGSGINSNYLNLLPEKKRESFLKKQIEYEQALIKYEQTSNPKAKIPTPPQLSKIDKQAIAKNLRIEDIQREVSYVIQNANTLRKASQDAIDRVNNLLAKVPKNERFGHPLASLKGNLTQLKKSAENVNPINDLKKLGVNKEILDAIDAKSQVIPEMTDTGSSIVSGLVQGLNSKLAQLETVSIDIASTPLEITKQINKIQSPSKEFEEIGKNLIEGEIKGIRSKEKDLQSAMAIIAKNITENRYDDFGFKEFFQTLRRNNPVIDKTISLISRLFISFVGAEVLQNVGMLFRQFAVDSFQSALNMERLETALNFSTGNAESSLANLKIQSDQLGTSFLSSAKNYQQFSASVINTPLEFQKDKIFEGITLGLATRGANSQQQDRALLAITQIASKGRVSMEELNQQLGEALPGALQIAARAYGVTSQEFIKLIESGSVASDEFLSKFATQTTLESAGGINAINDTAFVQVARFQNQMELFRISLGEPLLEATKLGLPLATKALKALTENGELVATVLASIGIVTVGSFVMVLKNLGLIDLALKALGITAKTTGGSISQIGVGLIKGLGWTALIFGVTEAFKALYQYINAGSEESKRSLKSTQESLQELRRLLEKPLPTPKASTVITDSATAIQQFKNNRERDKSLEFTAGGLSDTTQILRLSTDTFSDTKITEFTNKLDALRQKTKDLKIDEIIASGDADVKKATSVRQEIAKVNQEIQSLTEKYFPQIGLIVNEIASTEERITAIKKVLDDPESSKSQKDNASIQLETAEVQLKKLKESQEKYNEAVKENLVNYQRLTEQINKVARALSNIEFISSGRTILSETDIKRQVLSGNLKPFEIDLTVREQSLSIIKDQFNSLNGLLTTKEKELQDTLTDQINQRITELMPELNGIDFRTALQQGSVSPEAISDRLQQLGDQAPFELKQVLETAKQQASIRRQTLTIDKSIVDTELEIANARRERARNARQALIVGANVNERIATLRQLPFGGPAASYRDALSEVRNQERLLGEAYRQLESASDDPNVIQQEVDNTRLALEQARANLLQQQTSLQDYYRNLDRQIVDFNRQIEDYRRQIEDAQLSAFKENRSLSESYSDLVRELDKNLLNAQNQLLDTTDRIRVQQVKNRLLIPGTSDAGKELGDIFLEFVQGQADIASRGRTFQSRTEEIETSYISILRNIRNLQEQQQEAERNRLRTIEDIKRTQENLNRTLADLIRQTNRELGFIPQSIKDIVTNLNTLPEPIKLINSELVAIPQNIKTSGEDLVKSIEEIAEAIRKAKEQISQPSITGQFDSNLLPVPFLPKSRNGYLPPPPSLSPSQSSPSQNNSSNSNLETNLNRLLNKHNSPLTARDFIDASQKTGVSVDALVTQALIESHFGTKGRAAKTRNPLNYGNDDAGNNKFFSTFREGLIYAAQKLKEDFFFTTPEDFMSRNFRGRYGIYATDPLYGQKYRSALSNVRNELGISQPSNRTSNQPRTQSELEALRNNGNPANSGALNRVQQIRRNQGGPEFSSPPPIAQLPTLPNQNQDNFWDADLPPVLKDNPINFQNPNLPPVPKLPTGNLDAAAGQIRNAETANQEQEERLRQLESSLLTETTLDRAIKFGRQQEEEARDLNRTIRDTVESVTDLTINSKGYLTVQEEINKSATEVSRQYRSQIESLQDQRRNLEYQADGWEQMSENIKKMVAEQTALGQMPADVAEQFLKNADALAKRSQEATEQINQLDQAIEQLGKNQGVATLETSFRKTRDTVRSIRDRMNDLTIQRMKLEDQSRPTLFDDSAILAERINLQKEKEELEDYLQTYEGLPQYAEYVANIRSEWAQLAELRLKRAEIDASPNKGAAGSFFSDIREGKGVGTAFGNLGLNVLTKFVEGITKPAIDALTQAIDGFTKPITQAFESVFNSLIGPVGNFFNNALTNIFKPAGNIFSSTIGGSGGGGLFSGLLGGLTGLFGGGLGSIGKIASSGFASAPASAFSFGSGFKLFSDGGKVGKANAPIERNIISAFNRERSMSGGRRPRLIVANEDELILTPKETQAYLEYKNNAPIKNYANGGFVGGKPSYSTASNNNNSNQSLVINNTSNVTVESRNDMGYSINQLKERENTQNERTRKRFFG